MNLFIKTNEEGYIRETIPSDLAEIEGYIKLEERESLEVFEENQIPYLRYNNDKLVFDEEKMLEEKEKNIMLWINSSEKGKEDEAKRKNIEDILIRALVNIPSLIMEATINIDDSKAEILTDKIAEWAPDMGYKKNMLIKHNGIIYRIVNDIVKSQAHQAPGGVGMVAIYRPISPNIETSDGSKENPYIFIGGMDIKANKYYLYNNIKYMATQTIPNCIIEWAPGSAGVYFWKLIDGHDYTEPEIPEETNPVDPKEPEKETTSKENPIPYKDRMRVEKDKFYIHNSKIYQSTQDIEVCIWAPDSAGVYFWKLV